MKRIAVVLSLLATFAATGLTQEGAVPKGLPHLDHVFLIMMENHGYSEILHNPNARFINQYAKSANLATNYFAVAHPSLTNYLEVVGGRTSASTATTHPIGTARRARPTSPPEYPTPIILRAPTFARSGGVERMRLLRRWTARTKSPGRLARSTSMAKHLTPRFPPRLASPSPSNWSLREGPGRPIRKAC